MNKVIRKYPLKLTDTQELLMPHGGQILTAQVQDQYQGEVLCLWALVDPESPYVSARQIMVIGTGSPVESTSLVYISTVQMSGGALVWHIFEQP